METQSLAHPRSYESVTTNPSISDAWLRVINTSMSIPFAFFPFQNLPMYTLVAQTQCSRRMLSSHHDDVTTTRSVRMRNSTMSLGRPHLACRALPAKGPGSRLTLVGRTVGAYPRVLSHQDLDCKQERRLFPSAHCTVRSSSIQCPFQILRAQSFIL